MKALKLFFLIFGWVIAILLSVGTVSTIGLIAFALYEGVEDFDVVNPDRAVSVVELKGEIADVAHFRKKLLASADSESIRAIVVRIDSPGGSVGGSEEAFRTIKQAAKKKTVVCSLGNLAASGGLFAAMGCEKIITNAGTLTGSIGVIMMLPRLKGAMEQLNLGMLVVKSGEFKDTGSPFRDATPEDKAVLQALVGESYEQFVKVIADSRGLPVEKVKSFADGRIILGQQAVELGLADDLGGIDEAARVALTLEGVEGEPEVIGPKRKTGFAKMFDEAEAGVTWLQNLGEARLLYRTW